MLIRLLTGLAVCAAPLGVVMAASPAVKTGVVHFRHAAAGEANVPELFRLPEHRFTFQQEPIETAARQIDIFAVTLPSPVETPHESNNTVHCEYFRPVGDGPYPAVVVLHILGGDFDLSRVFCRTLAHHGVAALFVKMPYYGPRRQEGVEARMVMPDPHQTAAGMRQAVLDIRRATAWLASRDEVDSDQLGIFGISLGGITGALAAAVEPRLKNVCLMLAGGDIGRVTWSNPEMGRVRERWLAAGGTRESFVDVLRPIDPVTHVRPRADRRVLMLNARHDEIIPRECTESLMRAFGQPEIVWFDCGHYSAIRFLPDGLSRVTRFFANSP